MEQDLLLNRNNLFEEMKATEYKLGIDPVTGEWGLMKPKSLWVLFLDAIQKNPKLEHLKSLIKIAETERFS